MDGWGRGERLGLKWGRGQGLGRGGVILMLKDWRHFVSISLSLSANLRQERWFWSKETDILYQYHFHFLLIEVDGVILKQTYWLLVNFHQFKHNITNLISCSFFQTAFSKAISYSSLSILVLNYSGFQRIFIRILNITHLCWLL